MSRHQEIIARVESIDKKQEALEDDATLNNDGQFTPTALADYNKMQRERDKLMAEYRQLQDREKRKKESSPRQVQPLRGEFKHPSADGWKPPADKRSYAGLFGNKVDLDDTGDFEDKGEFYTTIASGMFDPRSKNLAGNYEYSDGDGGFLVPPSFSMALMDRALEGEIIRPLARVVPMTSRQQSFPRWDGYDHSSGQLYGGLSAEWTGEAETLTADNAKVEKMTLDAHRLVLFCRASNQLIEDAMGFADHLEMAMSSSIAFRLDEAFISGVGVGQPLGLTQDPAKITISAEVGQSSATIVWDNLTKMFARMYPAGRNRAVWLINNAAIPQLLSLSITIGTGGAYIPVMTETNGQFRILGRPVYFTEKCPTLGTEGDVILADLSQYLIGLRHDIRIQPSNQVYFASDETAFRGIVRVDGRGSWKSALTPKNGDSLSWIVTLATRA